MVLKELQMGKLENNEQDRKNYSLEKKVSMCPHTPTKVQFTLYCVFYCMQNMEKEGHNAFMQNASETRLS